MDKQMIQPIVAAIISSIIAFRAYRKKSLDLSGALAGFIVMTLHIAVNFRQVLEPRNSNLRMLTLLLLFELGEVFLFSLWD